MNGHLQDQFTIRSDFYLLGCVRNPTDQWYPILGNSTGVALLQRQGVSQIVQLQLPNALRTTHSVSDQTLTAVLALLEGTFTLI